MGSHLAKVMKHLGESLKSNESLAHRVRMGNRSFTVNDSKGRPVAQVSPLRFRSTTIDHRQWGKSKRSIQD